ncbi:STAS domain-containing protein [Virgisporangium ochraceum]|uniref:Anti-sigma factor antagonist n=1 Tax=Virgisporangium ochraceum TaxID=65505 RepID=A0A8J3ZXZ7_9ACTN|nr:STAS domain-containing protein [Virgisporangium ochraceum]GIJ70575.1 anti-sigma factor antagonist [Virgisporangium ochraceum]
MTAPLTITTGRGQHRLSVGVAGELDHSTTARLLDRVQADLLPTDTAVVIDTAGLTFCDSAGLGTMVKIHHLLADRGGRLTLTGPTPAMRRLLEITALDTIFTLDPPTA